MGASMLRQAAVSSGIAALVAGIIYTVILALTNGIGSWGSALSGALVIALWTFVIAFIITVVIRYVIESRARS